MAAAARLAVFVLGLHLLRVEASAICPTGLETYQQLCGVAIGDFQLLGSVCFPGSSNGELAESKFELQLTFNIDSTLTTDDLAYYYVYFFDDQEVSYPQVNRPVDGTYNNCSDNVKYARGHWQVTKTTPTIVGNLYTYTHELTVDESYAREWFLVLTNCGLGKPVELHSFTLTSDDAYDCEYVYGTNDGGYIGGIVFLVFVAGGLGVVAYVFWKKTKVPQLLSMDDTGYNEL